MEQVPLVVVADADDETRTCLEVALAYAGYRTLSVATASGVHAAVRAGKLPDFLVADVRLLSKPTQRLIASYARIGWPIPVGLTGDVDELDELAATAQRLERASGGEQTRMQRFEKPLDVGAVLSCVQDALEAPAPLRRAA
jgi:CheY-like chemotaxis protein